MIFSQCAIPVSSCTGKTTCLGLLDVLFLVTVFDDSTNLATMFLPGKSSQNHTCGQVLLAAWDSTAEKKTFLKKCSLNEIFTEHRKVRREGAAKAPRRGVRRQRGDGREEKQEEKSGDSRGVALFHVWTKKRSCRGWKQLHVGGVDGSR